MKHLRWHSKRRRLLFDSHDLRLGIFYVKGGSRWLHLPGVVIDLSSYKDQP